MPSWRSVRPGRQYVNLPFLASKTIEDTFKSIAPGEYNGKPQLIGLLTKLDMNVAINTNSCKALEEAWGEDFTAWVGKKIKITKGEVPFGAGKMPAIVIKPAQK